MNDININIHKSLALDYCYLPVKAQQFPTAQATF